MVAVLVGKACGWLICAIALPYIKNPSNDATFETFFSKQWVDNYTISLHNFLATTFQNMRKWVVMVNRGVQGY